MFMQWWSSADPLVKNVGKCWGTVQPGQGSIDGQCCNRQRDPAALRPAAGTIARTPAPGLSLLVCDKQIDSGLLVLRDQSFASALPIHPLRAAGLSRRQRRRHRHHCLWSHKKRVPAACIGSGQPHLLGSPIHAKRCPSTHRLLPLPMNTRPGCLLILPTFLRKRVGVVLPAVLADTGGWQSQPSPHSWKSTRTGAFFSPFSSPSTSPRGERVVNTAAPEDQA
jgi:hypothetical protein